MDAPKSIPRESIADAMQRLKVRQIVGEFEADVKRIMAEPDIEIRRK